VRGSWKVTHFLHGAWLELLQAALDEAERAERWLRPPCVWAAYALTDDPFDGQALAVASSWVAAECDAWALVAELNTYRAGL
jgi:hypothetical protein